MSLTSRKPRSKTLHVRPSKVGRDRSGQPNVGKSLSISAGGMVYERIPISTHTITRYDNLTEIVMTYGAKHLRAGDVLFITEKIVAISQGRAIRPADVKPSRLATFLSRYVQRTPHGIGLGMPETMELALREAGTLRILAAASVAAVTKPLGRRGDFYRIAGTAARAIDGPTTGTLPPYDRHIVLAPSDPAGVAESMKIALDGLVDVLVVDINDLGGNILGSSLPKRQNNHWVQVLADNPLGQGHESTPLGIIRRTG